MEIYKLNNKLFIDLINQIKKNFEFTNENIKNGNNENVSSQRNLAKYEGK